MQRRDFLRAGMSAAVAVSFTGLSLSLSRRAQAAPIAINIAAEQTARLLSAGPPAVSVPVWQFVSASATPGGSSLSQIIVTAGDAITLNLQNRLSVPVSFVVPGLLEGSTPAAPGSTQTYTFTAPPTPGTYVFYDGSNDVIGRAMGLGGALVVLPADGIARLYDGGPTYARDHLLVFNEMDTRLNTTVAAGGVFDMATYEPNYFFVNGVFYNGGRGVTINFAQLEDVSIRLVNAGLIYYPMHFHGWHVNVATRNRVIESSVVEKDTVVVVPGEAVETILSVGTQVGIYPLHTHYLPALTNNGVYLGGAMIMMVSA